MDIADDNQVECKSDDCANNASKNSCDINEDTDDNDQKSVNSVDQVPQPSLSRLLTLAQPEWGMLVIAVIVMICAEATTIVIPKILGTAYDDLLDISQTPKTRMNNVNRTMIIIMILLAAGSVLNFIRHSILAIIGERVVCRLRRCTMYRLMLSYKIYFFDVHKSGELVSRLGSDTDVLKEGTSQSMPEIFVGLIQVTVSIFIMFFISSELSSLMIGFLFFVILLAFPFGTLVGKLSKQYQNILGKAQSYSTEALQAMRTVQSFCAQEKEAD
jgi:putative ABC transport system ATP-binding protein